MNEVVFLFLRPTDAGSQLLDFIVELSLEDALLGEVQGAAGHQRQTTRRGFSFDGNLDV